MFKDFTVKSKFAMPVGTDAVLLGAWTNVEGARAILDIGTGSGVIALMMAQRSGADTVIDAIEPEKPAAEEAGRNFEASPWAPRLTIQSTALQTYAPKHSYDLIVTNPPYFTNSLLPPDAIRQRARHTLTLSHEHLLEKVSPLLSARGRFSIILPASEAPGFIVTARSFKLFPLRQCQFRSRSAKPPERMMLEMASREGKVEREELILYNSDSHWSDSYWSLTHAFYLKRR